MKTTLFDFVLPDALIATHPASPRDSARMLVVGDGLHDHLIRELPDFLKPGDVMVFNDTRVIPARLFGKRRGANIEILLHKVAPPAEGRGPVPNNAPDPATSAGIGGLWLCFAKPAKRLTAGDIINFSDDFHATVMKKLSDGQVVLRLNYDGAELVDQLKKHGHMPLPPYIERQRHADSSDQASYQTLYARHDGSVAAPTAGLHFTESLLHTIDAAGIKRVHVTLHVGGGTFLPVKTDDTDDHIMHSEYAEITQNAADIINEAKGKGGRIIAIGTTSLRTLESATTREGKLQAFRGETALFITPGYRFRLVDVLLTNFHLPRSTLFMLVSAFSGPERMKEAYNHAITKQYRFYSYGDACLLFCNTIY